MTDELAGVKKCLHDSPYPEVRAIRLQIEPGRIILRGRVRTYYMKQMAQEVLRNGPINGCLVVNEVEVTGNS